MSERMSILGLWSIKFSETLKITCLKIWQKESGPPFRLNGTDFPKNAAIS